MIRGTKNEGISSASKQSHSGGALIYTGIKGQSYELTESSTGVIAEFREEFDSHLTTVSDFPSSAFNGSFE